MTDTTPQQCICCQYEIPTEGPRLCPLCNHEFKGHGWDGIDAHWRAHHESTVTYEVFWNSMCKAHRSGR